jgi:hypothetical protein
MSVIGKPQCAGDSVLYLTTRIPDENIVLKLRPETSRDGRYWVITEDSKVQKTYAERVERNPYD